MPTKKLNIVFHAGKDAYHFVKARSEYSEKEHVNAIADQMYETGKYATYTAAMAAAVGVYDYQVALYEGLLINRAARRALEGKAELDDRAITKAE